VALVLTGVQNWQSLRNAAPVANALMALGMPNVMKWVTIGALTGMISSLAGFSIGTGARMVRHVARWPAARRFFPESIRAS
jgi:amino acid transporter